MADVNHIMCKLSVYDKHSGFLTDTHTLLQY